MAIVTGTVPSEATGHPDEAWRSSVWVVEDEPAAAELAVDLCSAAGVGASVFASPAPFLTALEANGAPTAVILDWRLERELSAALFLATRHRFPDLPVIYWTGSASVALPSMILDDAHTVVVSKADGTSAFERALRWALARDETAGHAP
jgi:DNA-binding NtrC family response regulator